MFALHLLMFFFVCFRSLSCIHCCLYIWIVHSSFPLWIVHSSFPLRFSPTFIVSNMWKILPLFLINLLLNYIYIYIYIRNFTTIFKQKFTISILKYLVLLQNSVYGKLVLVLWRPKCQMKLFDDNTFRLLLTAITGNDYGSKKRID
jgi:hypothetical protein